MAQAPSTEHTADAADPAEAIVHVIPWLIPVAGAILMFLLAFIAVVMAGLVPTWPGPGRCLGGPRSPSPSFFDPAGRRSGGIRYFGPPAARHRG